METYYVAETRGTIHSKNFQAWYETNCKTLASAKRAARKMQFFQGTNLFIAVIENGQYKVVSWLDVDALDMGDKGRWIDRIAGD